MLESMSEIDALLCPITRSAALHHEDMEGDNYELWSFEAQFNLLGWPSAVVRAGTSPEGLPIGVQIAAPPWRDDIALNLAATIETDFGGFQPPTGL